MFLGDRELAARPSIADAAQSRRRDFIEELGPGLGKNSIRIGVRDSLPGGILLPMNQAVRIVHHDDFVLLYHRHQNVL